MVGILPCAGRGTRLGEPIKELVHVAGRPMIEYALTEMERRGISQVILVVAPGKEQVAKYVALSRPHWHVTTVYQMEPGGTGRAVGLIWPVAKPGKYLYLMPDTLFSGLPVERDELDGPASLNVFCWQTARPEAMGVFDWSHQGWVVRHVEKRQPPWAGPYWAWGAATFEAGFIRHCFEYGAVSPRDEYTIDDAFDDWLRLEGYEIHATGCEGWYVDMGTPEGIADAESRWEVAGASQG